MLQTEFVRSLQCNYERILLTERPEEKRYQYCILNRGGIRGLLSGSLRYINEEAYLYYDISSMQNMAQIYGKRPVDREWLKDFIWSLHQIQQELGRFLLDDHNILLYPEQIFQDLESRKISFVYIPYYEGENGFRDMLEFWVEHIDYEDEILVECVYKMYEQFEAYGSMYLQMQIFEDAKLLEGKGKSSGEGLRGDEKLKEEAVKETVPTSGQSGPECGENMEDISLAAEGKEEKKGFFRLLEGRKRKREEKEAYQQEQAVFSHAVAEEAVYEEEYGKTIYMEETREETVFRLFSEEGKLMARIDKPVFTIGKKKGESDLVLEDMAVSRLHARIIRENDSVYLEDMNSTNGTYKNGLRLQPYEKRKLEREDEIKIGKKVLIYR